MKTRPDMASLRIVADRQIPLLDQLFANTNVQLQYLPAPEITRAQLHKADILLCRSVLPVNEALLSGTSVKFVATATSGSDHLAKDWLAQRHIDWYAAVGCNANAVAEYVLCSIAAMRQRQWLVGKDLTAAVVGVGQVGQRVVNLLTALGYTVLMHDPPRAAAESGFVSTPLDELHDVDLLCLHTPLTYSGAYPTYHLVNDALLSRLKPGCVVLNAGRGKVIDSQALLTRGQQLHWCLDVYEQEPDVDLAVIDQALLCTPHIAGHAITAKWRASVMVYQAVQRWLGRADTYAIDLPYPIPVPQPERFATWEEFVLAWYDPRQDMQRMRTALATTDKVGAAFSQLRNTYPPRFEFGDSWRRFISANN
jgi:erythronate-4-phosphate dehydrogenase